MEKNIKNSIIRDLGLGLIFFYLIFFPVFTSIPCQYIVIVISFAYLFSVYIRRPNAEINRTEIKVILGFTPFFIYLAFLTILYLASNYTYIYSNAYGSNFRGILYTYTYTIMVYLALKNYIKKKEITKDRIFNSLIVSAIIQLIFVLVTYMIPSAKGLVSNLIVKYSDDINIVNAVVKYRYRSYGLASNLFDGFGYLISILVSSVLLVGISKKKPTFIIMSIFMLLMPLLNTRTGLVLTIVGFIIILFYYFDFRSVFKTVVITLFVTVFLGFLLSKVSDYTQAWIKRGINETLLFLKGDKSVGIYNQIFFEDLIFPDNLMFGDGGSPLLLKNLNGIDSGYVQCIWRYGIIGTFILGIGYFNFFKTVYRKAIDKKVKCYIAIATVIFVLYLFKLFSITNYCGMTLIIIIPLLFIESENSK